MSNTGTSISGQPVNVNDQVSISATVVSTSGSGNNALVTFLTALSTSTFVCQGSDASAAEHNPDSSHPAISMEGKAYGFAGDQLTVKGTVTAISGSGSTALLTILLPYSNSTITGVPAGVCYAASPFGGTQ
jgi:hypothetical protein